MSLVWRLLLDLSGSLATFHDIIIHIISVCITNTIIGMIIVDFTVDYFLRTLMMDRPASGHHRSPVNGQGLTGK